MTVFTSGLRYLKEGVTPHMWCPGCGNGIVLSTLLRAFEELGYRNEETVVVTGIGCWGKADDYVVTNGFHGTHGRALAFATGMKAFNPRLNVVVLMGDGDCITIGGNHFIHAARRNIGVTALILNNQIYGMTGGQCSSATPQGDLSMTTPFGSQERPFDIVEMAKASGASYVARGTSFHANQLDKLISTAIMHPGFSVVEVYSPCPTQYGRKNKFKNAVDMYKWLKKNTVKVEQLQEGTPLDGRVPIGVFRDVPEPGLEERLAELKRQLTGQKQ